MNHTHSNNEHKAIVGRRVRMQTQATATPGEVTLERTQLISARIDRPRQLVVTLAQATTENGVAPWNSGFDGNPYIAGTSVFGAPRGLDLLRVELRWGAGGVAFQTAFDYPGAGGVFGVTADQLDVNVLAFLPAHVLDADVPTIGAWYVEGQAADPTPLRWREQSVVINDAASAAWSVKPYARRVRVASQARPAAPGVVASFLDVEGNTLWTNVLDIANTATGEVMLDVPSRAAVMSISNVSGGGIGCTVEWLAGLV